MRSRFHVALVALSLSGCASHEGTASTGQVRPDLPRAELTVAVASVLYNKDCPDPPETLAEVEADAEMERQGKRSAEGDWVGSCTQSTVQLSLRNTGAVAGKPQIVGIRLLDAAGERPLATMRARKPMVWGQGGYQRWDGTVAAGATIQVAYRLGEPTWSAEGGRSPGARGVDGPWILEVEVAVDGRAQTVRSPEFMRQDDAMVET